MKKLLLIGPWLADFGHGILLTILLLILFDVEPSILYFLLGIIFSILPDLDGITEFLRYKKIDAGEHGDHRDGLHYPLAWIAVGIVFILIKPFIGTLFTLCVVVHFINDSWGTGWGIEWLWPFNHRSYKLFSRNNVDADVTLSQLVTLWDPQSKNDTAKRLGNRNWVDDIYGHVTKISVVEYGTFILALFALAIYLSL